jgi:hypothetical protein
MCTSMFWVVAVMFVTYVATRLIQYNLYQHSELSNFFPSETNEDLDSISTEATTSPSTVHPNLHFAT